MTSIIPIPTSRTSDLLVTQRLLSQIQANQQELLRVQSQLSTGRRFSLPSEDAPAALRAITLQRILEQKQQVQVNLNTSQSFLGASDNAISGISSLLADIRGTAITVANTTSTDDQRQAALQEVLSALSELMNIGNLTFRGRYLFAGAETTVQPFNFEGENVVFLGSDSALRSYSDINVLFQTNATAQDVFGVYSPGIQGSIDLNPILSANTRLTDLRGGAGISTGSISVSDGTSTSIVDISSAETLGDVALLLELNPPGSRTITVRITATGLNINIDDAGGGNLTIREVGGATTVAELGILESNGVGTATIVGQDLDPVLTLTTSLGNAFGTRASTIVSSTGGNNDIVFELVNRGATGNGLIVQFVDDGLLQAAAGITQGNETVSYSQTAVAARASLQLSGADNDLILTATAAGIALNNVTIQIDSGNALGNAASASYDSGTKTLTLSIDSGGATTLTTLVNAIATEGTFTATADPSAGEGFVGAGTINPADGGVVTGNTGNSGGAAQTLFINIALASTTANDVVAAVMAEASVATLVTARLDEKDTLTTLAAGSGVVDISATGVTAGGSGVEFDASSGLRIVNGGQTHVISFQDAVTVEDLLNTLNGSAANVLAEINDQGTGINIRSRLSGSDFQIGENGGQTATQLGVRSFTTDTSLSSLNLGRGVHTTTGTDFTIQRNDGVTLDIDISTAQTIGDVLNLINNHTSNLDPSTSVLARLTAVGNGIEIVDDNPVGTGTLTISRMVGSEAVWDLGLLTQGVDSARTSDLPLPAAATASIALAAPNDINTAISLTASSIGSQLNGVNITFVNNVASGNQALVTYDAIAGTLTIDVDPAATTAQTVVGAITAEGTFTAVLDQTADPTNNGSGLIVDTGIVAVTAGGASNPSASAAAASVGFAPPNDTNTALIFTAVQYGTGLNGVDIVFTTGAAGNVADVSYDSGLKVLTIDVDPTATTAATVLSAVNTHGLFTAALDTTVDITNNGTGLVVPVNGAVAATTTGGAAEVFTGSDVNSLEVAGIFTTLIRLSKALEDNDLLEIQRVVNLLDNDLSRLNFSRAELGARQQGLDVVLQRLQTEDIELRSSLSLEIDVDLVEAISNLIARQAALQASLQTIAQTTRLTLLDYL